MKISIQIISGDRNDADHMLEAAQTAIFNGEKCGASSYLKGDRPMDSIYIMKAPGSYIYEVEEDS